MQNNDRADGAGDQSLRVMLMYEDLNTGARAMEALEQVASQLDPETDFDLELWRFDLLREPSFLNEAVDQAAQSDIVFLSLHGNAELQRAGDLWLKKWMARKGARPSALAVSLDDDACESPVGAQVVELLHAAARPAGVEVFFHQGEAQGMEPEMAVGHILRRAESKTVDLLEHVQRFEELPRRDWGINE